jgi:hypothetical protein
MCIQLPLAGSASSALAALVHSTWVEQARQAGICLKTFPASGTLADRIAWAVGQGLDIGCVLSRYSTDMQQSTDNQVYDCVYFAARNRIYTPAEYVCVDEGVTGKQTRRDGLDRVKMILAEKMARILLVFKVSRLFRVGYKGARFIQEEVVDEDLRAISVSEGLDTANPDWRSRLGLQGIIDENTLTVNTDFARSANRKRFRQGYAMGAATLGYQREVIPDAPPTRSGKPSCRDVIDPQVAALIVQHFEWIRDGMPVTEGWYRWVTEGGPVDKRSKSGHMSYPAYRRMLSNKRYMGHWEYGRRRSKWSNKRDYVRQVLQPDSEVEVRIEERLRIVSDELFMAVQERLAKHPRGSTKRSKRPKQLCDLVLDCFFCAACSTPERPIRFQVAGSKCTDMRCGNKKICRKRTYVRRDQALGFVLEKLQALLLEDTELVDQVAQATQTHDAEGEDQLRAELGRLQQRLTAMHRKIDDLIELAGQGSPADRAQVKSKIKEAQTVRASLQAGIAQLESALQKGTRGVTAQQVRETLANLSQLLADAAAGNLGSDLIYQAAAAFRQLVGGRIMVHAVPRPGRKRGTLKAVFQPTLLNTVRAKLELPPSPELKPAPEFEVFLRPVSKDDRLSDRVYHLIAHEGLSHGQVVKVLQAEGETVQKGQVRRMWQQYFILRGLPVPERKPGRRPNKPPRAA